MRALLTGLLWTSLVLGVGAAGRAGVEYHFMPGVEGQTIGISQFLAVSPVVGPKDFQVLLSGALIGSDPSADANTARPYLDKWGVGVLNPAAGRDVGVQGQVQVDGRHGGEYLRLEFAAPVRLTYLTFSSVGIYDEFALLADGVTVDDLYPLDVERAFASLGRIYDNVAIWYEDGKLPIEMTNAGQAGMAAGWNVRPTA